MNRKGNDSRDWRAVELRRRIARMVFWPAVVLIAAFVFSRCDHRQKAARESERRAPGGAHRLGTGRTPEPARPAEIRNAPSVAERASGRGDVLFDDKAAPEARLAAFERRLRREDPESMKDAQRFLAGAPAWLQLKAVSRLGRCRVGVLPERRRAVLEWAARHASTAAAVYAVRLLGAEDRTDASAILGDLLADRAIPSVVRAEAARTLGAVGGEAAFERLVRSIATEPDAAVFDGVVAGLARFPFEQVRPLFESLLADSARTTETRASAIEALAESSDPAAAEFVSRYLADSAPDVREAAAWALAAFEGEEAPDAAMQRAVRRLAQENVPDVRKHLYEFLAESAQSRTVLEQVAERAASETDPGAQFAGWRALSFRARSDDDDVLRNRLVDEALPAVTAAALDESAPADRRLQAVMVLSNIGGAEAQSVLERVCRSADPHVARAAESALRRLQRAGP